MVKNYNQPILVYVNLEYDTGLDGNGQPTSQMVKYAFGSRLNESLMNNLGQVPITASMITDQFVQSLVVGSSNIKPRVARKLGPLGWDSSFCGDTKIPDLVDDGWDISRATGLRTPNSGPNSLMLKVPINGINYGYVKAKEPENQQPDLSVIGVEDASLSDNLLFFGCEFPVPPRFTKKRGVNAAGTGASKMSTFGARNKLGDTAVTNAKWSGSGGRYTANHFPEMFSGMLA